MLAGIFAVRAGIAATPPGDPASNVAISSDPTDDKAHWAARLSLTGSYDDNIFIQSEGAESDFIIRAAPSVAYGVGNFLAEFTPFSEIPLFFSRPGERELPHDNFAFASYTPEGVWFASNHEQDTINHDARVVGRTGNDLWSLYGQLRFRSLSDANIDLGRRVRQTYYTGTVSGTYALTGRTKAAVTLEGEHHGVSGGLSSDEGRATAAFDYQVAPKTEVGLGATVGQLDVKRGENQTYTRPMLRLKYAATEKITLSGEAGEEFRHFSGDVDDRSQFVFGLNGEYQPRDGTTISVSGRRDTLASAEYAGENIVSTTYEAGVRQRFLRRHTLGLAGGYVHNHYENNSIISVVSRRDDYYFGKFGASRDVTKRGTVDLAYEYRTNDSSVGSFGFRESVVSLSLSLLY